MSTQHAERYEQVEQQTRDEAELRADELEEVAGGARFAPNFEERPIVDPLPEKIRRKRRRESHAQQRQARE